MEKIRPDDLAASVTRDRWLRPLFQELAYGRLQRQSALVLGDREYPIYTVWGHVPIHFVGSRVDLDYRMPSGGPSALVACADLSNAGVTRTGHQARCGGHRRLSGPRPRREAAPWVS